jgi:hypothetical protein
MITPSQIAERAAAACLHKTLRQACSSKAAFLVWHLLNGKDEDIALFWLVCVTRALARLGEKPAGSGPGATLSEIFTETPAPTHGASALRLAAEMIPLPDWDILAATLAAGGVPARSSVSPSIGRTLGGWVCSPFKS